MKDSVKYSYDTVMEFSSFILKNDNQNDSTIFKANYPVFEEKDWQNATASSIYMDGDSTMEEEAHRFIAGYDEYVEENTTAPNTAWFRNLNVKVINNSSALLSVKTEMSDYTGGAHGNYVTIYTNFDRSTRDKIVLNTIVDAENMPKLLKIAEQIFRKQEKLSATDKLSGRYFFENDRFYLPEYFTFSPNSLKFIYNLYEIKPYVDGLTPLDIPFSAIKELLNEKGLTYFKSLN